MYAAAIALGFASIENIFYVMGSVQNNQMTSTIIFRAIFTVPGHVLFSTIWGYGISRIKFYNTGLRSSWVIIRSLMLAMVAHGLFNFTLVVADNIPLVLVIFLALIGNLWMTINRNYKEALLNSPFKKSDTVDKGE